MHGTCKGLCRGPLLPGPILDIYPMCGHRSGLDCGEIPIDGRYYRGKILTNIMVLGKGTRNGSQNDIGHDILADRYDVKPGPATCCKAEFGACAEPSEAAIAQPWLSLQGHWC